MIKKKNNINSVDFSLLTTFPCIRFGKKQPCPKLTLIHFNLFNFALVDL